MYVAGNFEAENSLITMSRCNDGHWSTFTGKGALLPSDIIDFAAMLPTQGFWRETLSL